eukprot:scaffold97935_cov25-Tisochrysis_lutea.AAC.3
MLLLLMRGVTRMSGVAVIASIAGVAGCQTTPRLRLSVARCSDSCLGCCLLLGVLHPTQGPVVIAFVAVVAAATSPRWMDLTYGPGAPILCEQRVCKLALCCHFNE